MEQLRVLTWHVHGNYLYYLGHVPVLFYLPTKPGRPEGYGGRSAGMPWPDNLVEVPAEDVRDLDLDAILFQSSRNYTVDQYEILTARQRRLPRVFLEHDPPRENPTDTRHVVDDPAVLLVHVTPFNDLMWDSGDVPTAVVEHGVTVPESVRYTGEIERGLVIVNNIASRGRRLGLDMLERARQEIPIDLVGMGAEAAGGIGEIPHDELPAFAAMYRFVFNPIRYTSLGLAICEAMLAGCPIVALATTEMATVVQNGVNGYADTDVDRLIRRMSSLLARPDEAKRLSRGARRTAADRFGMDRFIADWSAVFRRVVAGTGVHTISRPPERQWRRPAARPSEGLG